jgi:threonine dehydrogenase-like Zn-dependent dehydrogenase
VVRALFSGVSRGTEALVFLGRVPRSQHAHMRAPFQEGDFPAPVKYGYASVGYVEAGPQALLNQPIFCLFPHQTRYVVPAAAAVPLPAGVTPGRAVLAANLETAINGVWDAGISAGDRVAVVGGGTVGCLVAWLAGKIPGCEVELVDVDTRRGPIALALGVAFAAPERARRAADVIIHASGTAAGLDLSLQLAGFEGTIVEMSWHGDRPVPLALGEQFHSQRLTLKSSQVGWVAPDQRARWSPARRLHFALTLLNDPVLDVLINSESRFEELPDVLARLASHPDGVLLHRVRYD